MSQKEFLKLLEKGLKLYPKIVALKAKRGRAKQRFIKKNLPYFRKMINGLMEKEEGPKKQEHPWRMCGPGQHWVRDHSRRNAPLVHGHCCNNPSRKSHLHSDEIHLISEKYFTDLSDAPTPNNLGHNHGNDYDALIRGWTKFWNETLKPSEPLDPNLVKALIATESGFEREATIKVPGKNKKNSARGLMQVTDETRKILGDKNGELKSYVIELDSKNKNEIYAPDVNIAAGIRWLFWKKVLAGKKLKRDATWIEAVAEYKSYLRDFKKNPTHAQMNKLINFYHILIK